MSGQMTKNTILRIVATLPPGRCGQAAVATPCCWGSGALQNRLREDSYSSKSMCFCWLVVCRVVPGPGGSERKSWALLFRLWCWKWKWVDGWPDVVSSGADELQVPLSSRSGRRDGQEASHGYSSPMVGGGAVSKTVGYMEVPQWW
jgi:hypothetical protein